MQETKENQNEMQLENRSIMRKKKCDGKVQGLSEESANARLTAR
jgi:hypothetical protein